MTQYWRICLLYGLCISILQVSWGTFSDGLESEEENNLEELVLLKQTLEQQVTDLQNLLNATTNEMKQAKAEVTRLTEEKDDLLKDVASLKYKEGQLESCQEDKTSFSNQLEDLQKRHDHLQTKYDEDVQTSGDCSRNLIACKKDLTDCKKSDSMDAYSKNNLCVSREIVYAIASYIPSGFVVIIATYCFRYLIKTLYKTYSKKKAAEVEANRADAENKNLETVIKVLDKKQHEAPSTAPCALEGGESQAVGVTPIYKRTSDSSRGTTGGVERLDVSPQPQRLTTSGLRHRRSSGSSITEQPIEEESRLTTVRRFSSSSRDTSIDTPVLTNIIQDSQNIQGRQKPTT